MEEIKMNKAKVIEALNMTIAGLTILRDELPTNWTYPTIQPYLLAELEKRKVI